MEYKIKNVCENLGFGVSRFYALKKILDNSIPEQNRIEYYYNKGRNFFITEKGFNWFKENNIKNYNIRQNSSSNISIYQNQIIEMYKERIEYLENENKRLLDIISVKEQRELAKDVKVISDNKTSSFFNRFTSIFKTKQ